MMVMNAQWPPWAEVNAPTPTMTEGDAAKLREAFPPSAIGKLPRAGITLDFVGHADVTDRLLQVDPGWTWEPAAFAEDGGPLIRNDGKVATLWIKLTVCGVTRYGVGNEVPSKFDLEKLLIGDALRNAAMRFGVALDLWKKGDLDDRPGSRAPAPAPRGVDAVSGEVGPLATEDIGAMKPRELHDACVLRGLDADGSIPDLRDRLYHWSQEQASGMGGSRTPGDDEGSGSPLVTAPSIPVSEPAAVPRAASSNQPAAQGAVSEGNGGGLEVSGDAGLREDSGAVDGASSSPDTTPLGAVPIVDSGKGYEAWKRRDLIIECAERDPVIDTLSNATISTLVEQLRAWDRLHRPGATEYDSRPF